MLKVFDTGSIEVVEGKTPVAPELPRGVIG